MLIIILIKILMLICFLKCLTNLLVPFGMFQRPNASISLMLHVEVWSLVLACFASLVGRYAFPGLSDQVLTNSHPSAFLSASSLISSYALRPEMVFSAGVLAIVSSYLISILTLCVLCVVMKRWYPQKWLNFTSLGKLPAVGANENE